MKSSKCQIRACIEGLTATPANQLECNLQCENHVKIIRSTIWPSKDGRLVGLYMWIYNHTYIWQTRKTVLKASIYINVLSISLGLIPSVSPWARTWMIFIINTLWIIVISWLLCWFCTSSGRRVCFHFTNIWCKIARGIWQLGATSLSLLSTGYSSSDSPCMDIAFVLCIFLVVPSPSVLKS